MLRLFLSALVIFSCSTSADAEEPYRLRVLSYNIHHAEGLDGRLDVDRIASVINGVSPDVVALQEVDRKTNRVGGMDQPRELARRTNMQVVFERNINYQGGEYGNAVLSKIPIDFHRNVHLPSFDDGEQRGVLVCELAPESLDHSILLLCTHLDHRADDQERQAAARRINQIVADHEETPAVLAGDLNATPDSAVLELFGQRWQTTSKVALPTSPAENPRRQIDFVLFRPAARWRVAEFRVLDESIASDHRPILAVLELQPPSADPASSD